MATADMPLRSIPLEALHQSLGAKMAPFAGYLMPVRYSGDIEEHVNVRENVGVFDVSHMGEFRVYGPDALAFVNQVTSNDVAALFSGKVQYSTLTNLKGGIVDDLLVYCVSETDYYLVVNASNIDKDWQWLQSQMAGYQVQMQNLSDDYSLFAVQGPNAEAAIRSLTSLQLADMPYYTFQQGAFAGVEEVIISTTGYTGAGGYEIYVPAAHSETVWKAIFEAGAHLGIKPTGLAARDTLRLEMGFCLYGNDISDDTLTLEAGLGWITKLKKADFNGKAAIVAAKEAGLQRKLTPFRLLEKAIPRSHYQVCAEDGTVLGEVTSGTMSPSLGYGIGLAYLPLSHTQAGTPVYLNVRGKLMKAEVCTLPFFQKA